jgi:hypothetical protein
MQRIVLDLMNIEFEGVESPQPFAPLGLAFGPGHRPKAARSFNQCHILASMQARHRGL